MQIQFWSALIIALLVHMYLMTNGFINHDSTVIAANNQWFNIASGRWFAAVPDAISTHFNLLWVNSMFSVLYISLAACLVGACLRITRTPLILILSALVVSFPAVASGLSDRFEADKFFFAVLLACLAAYLTRRFRFGAIAGAVLLVFSLATYQAYVGFFAGLVVLMLIRDLLTQDNVKPVLLRAAKYLLTLIVALGAYAVSVKLTVTGDAGYKDIGGFGGLSLQSLPGRIVFAYRNVFDVFVRNSLWIHQDFTQNGQRFKWLFVVAALTGLLLLINIVLNTKMYRNVARLVSLAILIAVIPIAIDAVAIVSPDYLYILMQYSLVLLFAFILVVVDVSASTDPDSCKPARAWAVSLSSWYLLGLCCLVAFSYALYTNVFYSKVDLINKQGQNYSATLVTRIQSQDYYTTDKPIILIGAAGPSFGLGYYANYSAVPIEDMPNMYSYSSYLLDYFDVRNPVSRWDGSLPDDLTSNPQAVTAISEMPLYPDAGSVEEVAGYIVVKLSN